MFYCPPSLLPSFIFILPEPISFLPLFLLLRDYLSPKCFFAGENFGVEHIKIFKPLLILLTKLLLFLCFGPLDRRYVGIAPQQGIESASPALEAEVLTTGPPGKSHSKIFEQCYPALTLLVSKYGQAPHNTKLLLDRMTISASKKVSWETKSWPTYLLNGNGKWVIEFSTNSGCWMNQE